jgi:hypothetical protein
VKILVYFLSILSIFILAFDSYARTLKKDNTMQMESGGETEEESISVQVDGVGTLKDDVAAARKMAISDGLRIAVEQAKGVMVKGETEVKDFAALRDEVVSKTRGFVRTYKILSEKQEGNIYRVTLEVEVMLSDPKAAAPVRMDEQRYKADIPRLLQEARSLFEKTNHIAESLRSKRHGNFISEDIRSLRQRYIVLMIIMRSIEPPPDKKERMRPLIIAARLKARATNLFARFLSGDRNPELLRKGFELNRKGNQLLREFRAG